jgi:hypothetical protein
MLSSTAMTLMMTGLPVRAQTTPAAPDTDWRGYANDLANTRYCAAGPDQCGQFRQA